jgi:lipopolysaccharide transport system ATP-binding protein
MTVAIKIENLSKQYRLGLVSTRTLSHDLNRWWQVNIRGKEDPYLKIESPTQTLPSGEGVEKARSGESFWALKDINLEVQKGDVLGIIGKNGAGKSTLLKILSKVTAPTTGTIKARGRIASLLEVGTGFHYELTGRENIYMNGAVLGMTKTEINRKLDEIIDFSGVERFIDTPVKRYSSGMFVRLGFAVAAHLDPEILVVDEVLAVGDAEFQKKAIGKMQDISTGQGRTVLFVSHNLNAVKKLCASAILLENGIKVFQGKTTETIDRYIYQKINGRSFTEIQIKEIEVTVKNVTLNKDNEGFIYPTKPLRIDIELEAAHDIDTIGIGIWFSGNETDGNVFTTNTKTVKNMDIHIKKGKNTISCLIKNFNLCSGKYWLGFGISQQMIRYYYYENMLISFTVPEVFLGQSLIPTSPDYGLVYLDHDWIIEN